MIDEPKSSVPAKSAALELLGKLGSAINDLLAHLKDIHRNRSVSSSIDGMLSQRSEEYLAVYQDNSGKTRDIIKEEKEAALRKMLVWKGPFKMILEQLWEKDQRPDEDNLQVSVICCDIEIVRVQSD